MKYIFYRTLGCVRVIGNVQILKGFFVKQDKFPLFHAFSRHGKFFYILFVANPLALFFTRLAPEDKKFIRRIGIVAFALLVVSGVVLYFITRGEVLQTQNSGELPAPPLLDMPNQPDFMDVADLASGLASNEDKPASYQTAPDANANVKNNDPFADDFDGQAHLQLMRTKAKEYNYREAYKHGERIEGKLIKDPKLSAQWGHILLETGKVQDAVSVLSPLENDSSMVPAIAEDYAFALFRNLDVQGALDFLDGALKTSGKNKIGILTVKAAIIGEHPDTTFRSGADSLFKYILKISPNFAKANYQYGRYLMQKGNFQNSKTYLEKAVKLAPQNPKYIARLGMAEFYLKNDSRAEALYKKSLSLNQYDYNTWFNLGELYLSQANESTYIPSIKNNTRKALEAYLKAIENNNIHANAHYRVGVILNGNGEYRESISHLQISLDRSNNKVPSLQQLSAAYLQLGDTAQGAKYLYQILEIDPFNKIAADNLGRIKSE